MKKYYIYILALLIGSIISCQKQVGIDDEQQPIVFKSYLKEGSNITPMSRNIGGNLYNGYMLGGAWSTAPFLTNNKVFFLGAKDRAMYIDGTPQDPNYPKIFWRADGTTQHTFYAYTANPSGTPAGFGITDVRQFPSYTTSNTQGVCVLFKQHDDPALQIDLLTADNTNIVVTPGSASAVNLYFAHRFSKVSLKVFGTGGANITDCQAKIVYGANAPLSTLGSASMAGAFIIRTALGNYEDIPVTRLFTPHHSGSYNLGAPFDINSSQDTEIKASLAGSMIFIPQLINTGWATIELEYSIDGAAARYTAKAELPELGQLSPSKEYLFLINLIERNQSLSIANVRLLDWNSQDAYIDNLPGIYTLSISANKPTDAKVPKVGASYAIKVTSNRAWSATDMENVTVTPTNGPSGTTDVTITVAETTLEEVRRVLVRFNTTGSTQTMVSAEWRGEQVSAAPEGVEAGDLLWATGNLVANGANGCKIGQPTDGGLFFQFGSLIGWKGGATGNGVGRAAKMNNSYYGGTSFNAANEVAVIPKDYNGFASVSSWPTTMTPGSINLFFSDTNYGGYRYLSDYQGLTNGDHASKAVGDPCRYYLGGKWRLPRDGDYGYTLWRLKPDTEINEIGDFIEGTTTAYMNLVLGTGAIIDFPVVGIRSATNGSIQHSDYTIYYSTEEASLNGETAFYNLHKTGLSAINIPRSHAAPVRCVSDK